MLTGRDTVFAHGCRGVKLSLRGFRELEVVLGEENARKVHIELKHYIFPQSWNEGCAGQPTSELVYLSVSVGLVVVQPDQTGSVCPREVGEVLHAHAETFLTIL